MRLPSERILLSVPHLSGREIEHIQDAFASGWVSTVGPAIDSFESEFSAKLGGIASVAVASGTAALHLALQVAGVGPGDLVICPTLTFVATANAIRYCGAEPVFVDSSAASWNLDPVLLKEALTTLAAEGRRAKAVLVVHLFGQCADMDPILKVCGEFDIPIIEDAAEALGASYRGKPAGTLGHIGAFSFNGNKMITTSGGGMLVSRISEWATKARFLATQARNPGIAYDHSEMGYNYRLSNILAALGLGQLEVLSERVASRQAIFQRYCEALANVDGIAPMPVAPYGEHSCWLSCFTVDRARFGASRDELMRHLDAMCVESRPVWKPMHQQPLYRAARCFETGVSDQLFADGICLPSSSSLSVEEQNYIVRQIQLCRHMCAAA